MELPRLPPGGEVGGAGLSVQATAIRSVASTSSRRPHHSDRDATGRDDAAPSHAGSNAAGDLSGWSSEEGSHMLPLLPSAQAAPAEAGVAVPRASVGPSGGAAPPRARTTVKSLSYSRKRDGGGLTSAELMHRGDDAGSGVPAPARRSASARKRGAAAAKPTAAEPSGRVPAGAPLSASSRWRFAVFPGNSSRLVIQCFRHRGGWCPFPIRTSGLDGSDAAGESKSDAKSSARQRQKVRDEEAADADALALTVTSSCNFIWEMYRNRRRYEFTGGGAEGPRGELRYGVLPLLNHFQHNACLVSKLGLYRSLVKYFKQLPGGTADLDAFVPRTCILRKGCADSSVDSFREQFESVAASGGGRIWILKPGKNANRGCGIVVVDSIEDALRELRIPAVAAAVSAPHGDPAAAAGAGGCASLAVRRERRTDPDGSDEPEDGDESSDSDAAEHGRLEPASVASGGGAASKASSGAVGDTCAGAVGDGAAGGADSTAGPGSSAAVDGKGKGRGSAEWIVQKYLEHPLLVNGRKFDIRVWVLLVAAKDGTGVRGYVYQDYYIRTSSKPYSLSNIKDRVVHLTNDAVQKKTALYGKFEAGNKLDLEQFAAELQKVSEGGEDAGKVALAAIFERITELVRHTLAATAPLINKLHRPRCFELMGYDFMVDDAMNVWLIEVNSNPCLELSSPYLSRIVPCLLEHTMQLTVDVSFPPQAPARSGGGTRSGMPSHEMIGAECGANRYLKVFES